MILFKDLEDEIDKIILFDTNVFINLEHINCSKIDLKAIKHLINIDYKPFITDLSFCELIIGCRDLDDYKFHIKEFNDMEFLICGFQDLLGTFLSNIDFKSIDSNEKFTNFKKTLIDLRDDVLFPCFYKMHFLFSIICRLLLNELDSEFWKEAIIAYTNFYKTYETQYLEMVKKVYKEFINVKSESKKLLKEIFIEIFVLIIKSLDIPKYKGIDLESKIRMVLVPKYFTKIIDALKIRKNSDENSILIGFINKFKKQIYQENDVDTINVGICFLIYKMIFSKTNYNSHDLIDILNIGFVYMMDINTYYYTNDYKKWECFIEILNNNFSYKKIILNYE